MKNSNLLIRTAIILAIVFLGIYLVIGPRHLITAKDFTWQGIKNNLAENINLGLDLKGGSHLVMRVKTEDYLKNVSKNNKSAAFLAAQSKQLPVKDSSNIADNGEYQFSLTLSDTTKTKEVIRR